MILFYTVICVLNSASLMSKISYLKSLYGSGGFTELIALRHLDEISGYDYMIDIPTIPRMISSLSQVVCFISVWCLALILKKFNVTFHFMYTCGSGDN